MLRTFIQLVLVGAVFSSAIGVVLARHESRKLFIELQNLEKYRDEMDIEWGRLQLEESTWATHGRVEQLAIDRLDMIAPEFDANILVSN